jgi:hypothetical protein
MIAMLKMVTMYRISAFALGAAAQISPVWKSIVERIIITSDVTIMNNKIEIPPFSQGAVCGIYFIYAYMEKRD